jgi:regulatory protein
MARNACSETSGTHGGTHGQVEGGLGGADAGANPVRPAFGATDLPLGPAPAQGQEPAPDMEPTAGPGRRRARPQQTPVQRALGLLVRREHSRKELTRKLAARGIEAEEAASAVDRLAAEGWQDDERFAESLVRSRAGSGYGPLYIRSELATHGLDSEAIARAMDTFEGDWAELARDLVCRRFGEQGPQELGQRRKAADLLARRGFDGSSIRLATRYDPDEA